jgi:hypothetical protein
MFNGVFFADPMGGPLAEGAREVTKTPGQRPDHGCSRERWPHRIATNRHLVVSIRSRRNFYIRRRIVMAEFEKTRSPAYLSLRASAKRVLKLVESEVARQGGAATTIHIDQLEVCGTRRVYRLALAEIHALGLLEIARYPKRYVCRPSDRWREIRTIQHAQITSTMAREHLSDDRTTQHADASATITA